MKGEISMINKDEAYSIMQKYIEDNIPDQHIYLMRDFEDAYFFVVCDKGKTSKDYDCLIGCNYLVYKKDGKVVQEDFYMWGEPLGKLLVLNE